MTDVVKRAAEVLERYSVGAHVEWVDHAAKALSAAGLLVTPEVEACVEACAAYHRKYPTAILSTECYAVSDAGRAILAARAPKERWGVHEFIADKPPTNWCITDNGHQHGDPFTEAQARAVAAALNALEGPP